MSKNHFNEKNKQPNNNSKNQSFKVEDKQFSWREYKQDLEEGYFEIKGEQKCLKPKFIVEYPNGLADIFKRSYNKNNTSQIRKFYDHVKLIQSHVRVNKKNFDSVKAWLNELIPHANFALQRDVITQGFFDFIQLNINEINDLDDLNAFAKHFQSLIAFMPKENNR